MCIAPNEDKSQTSDPVKVHAAAEHKARVGIVRLWHAGRYSLDGLRAASSEKAFRLEASIAMLMLPASVYFGRTWLEVAMLSGSVVAVLVVELLNSSVESAVDRIGTEWHVLSKRAKDIGSAAVLLTLLWCGAVWVGAIWALWK